MLIICNGQSILEISSTPGLPGLSKLSFTIKLMFLHQEQREEYGLKSEKLIKSNDSTVDIFSHDPTTLPRVDQPLFVEQNQW